MGKLGCYCGNVISDSSAPSPIAGSLIWEPDEDTLQTEATEIVADFLSAVGSGDRETWVERFFGDEYPKVPDSDVISDIYNRSSMGKTYSVLRCSECERIYIQTKPLENEWTCFEPRQDK